MKRILKWYTKLYNQKNYSEAQGWIVSLRWDRVKHGFIGDIIKAIVLVLIGNWNNWGGNIHFESGSMWWLYYVLVPMLIAFFVGFSKEMYDKQKKGMFDWGDIWATVLPFALVYLWFKELLHILFRKKMAEIYEEIMDGQ